ncbi:ABC transporter permease [Actinobacteria bacterium YIM 96077]|uniref:ABC transporter permease n=1 Tax=Phytoactinopolyspora halophila TaxID=1981511 RepID=A0A329QL46_9ACTN|nr:ABC transporter permease [Phytoactinopolyspora halophila]AYY15731.1 ABC transporter permease [Actinobacteria bacterium YIM 96077]RAW13157.1 ABC transporter permease [Phytoactinopolyspora halophila]
MSTLLKTTAVEGKLFLREPMSVIFGVLFPTALLLGLGAIPALREPSDEFDGARFVELWTPTALVLGLAILGLQHIPGVVATYRENGILRRMSTTPVHPAKLLVAQLTVALVAAVVAAVLLIIAAWLVLDVSPPEYPFTFALAFLVGFGALLAIGLLIAAVAPNARAASGLAIFVFMLVMLVGGVYMPRFLMPEFLIRLGDYTPPGVQALLDAWLGDTAAAAAVGSTTAGPSEPLQLGIMGLIAVVAGWSAARLFRWE